MLYWFFFSFSSSFLSFLVADNFTNKLNWVKVKEWESIIPTVLSFPGEENKKWNQWLISLGSPSVSTCNLKFGTISSDLLFTSRGHSCETWSSRWHKHHLLHPQDKYQRLSRIFNALAIAITVVLSAYIMPYHCFKELTFRSVS